MIALVALAATAVIFLAGGLYLSLAMEDQTGEPVLEPNADARPTL